MERLGIIGSAQFSFGRYSREQMYAQIIPAVIHAALRDSGLVADEIDCIVAASDDFGYPPVLALLGLGDLAGGVFMGGHHISLFRHDGAVALKAACAFLAGGIAQLALVLAFSFDNHEKTGLREFFDPLFEAPLDYDHKVAAALQARVYLNHYDLAQERLAAVVVKNRSHGVSNDGAALRENVDLNKILATPYLAPPLRPQDVAPAFDSAAAIVLAREDLALKLHAAPIWIEGFGFGAEPYYFSERRLWNSPALTEAAQKAYSQAGIKEPLKEIDAAELSELFSYQEPMSYEALGFCRAGEGLALIDNLVTLPGGELPVNLSGGCLCGYSLAMAGLGRIIEAVRQLQGRAGNQLDSPRCVLAHSQYGLCGQTQSVWILKISPS